MTQAILFAGDVQEWRCDVPPTAPEQGLHKHLGRGGYVIMGRAPWDPDERQLGVKEKGLARVELVKTMKKRTDLAAFVDAIEGLLHPELGGGGSWTLHRIGCALVKLPGSSVAGSVLEEALWFCVREKSARWRCRGHLVEFAAWPAGDELQAALR